MGDTQQHTLARTALTWIRQGLTLLPASAARFGRAAAGRRPADAASALPGIGLGLLAWFLALLCVQGAVNATFYPLVDAHDYQHSWGGPTLIGAWAAHLAVAVPCEILALCLLRGLTALGASTTRRWWRPPLALVVLAAGLALFAGWVNQL